MLATFDQSICADLQQASSREWLETNSLGGFACTTITGMNTRRYHGLLTAATKPPVGRELLLSKLEETLIADGKRADLSTNQYEGAVHPRGYLSLRGFRLDPWPVFTFESEGVIIEKSVFLAHDSNTVLVSYELIKHGQQAVELEIRPLIAFRDYHSTTHSNDAIRGDFHEEGGIVSMCPYPGMPQFHIAHNDANIEAQGYWYRNFRYDMERERGLDFHEDLFNPFVMKYSLSAEHPRAIVIASLDRVAAAQFDTIRKAELDRRARVLAAAPNNDPLVVLLTAAAEKYIARRGNGYTVMAGYPWFTDWGRDTMIALPGLTLYNGQAEVAREILRTFGGVVDRGMLPNRFPDDGEVPEYNTVDATLWYIEAIRRYVELTDDFAFAQELYPTLLSIIEAHIVGTRYNIHMLDNGLLEAGAPGVQLTWMDAKVGDRVITPRSTKPVEIQALWYNALLTVSEYARRFGDNSKFLQYQKFASMLKWTFTRTFWNDRDDCLYDVVNGVADPSIRPNQIIAVSLHHSMLNAKQARAVLDTVTNHLLTPLGLRTLSPMDPKYCGSYAGDSVHRDSVYHQGTVWPWLMGPYISALIKVNGATAEIRSKARKLLVPFEAHLLEAGIGHVSEILDGDAPHKPQGCFAQAWSVGELLRTLCEDIYQIGKKEQSIGTGAA